MRLFILLALLLMPYLYLYSQDVGVGEGEDVSVDGDTNVSTDVDNKPQLIARIIIDGGLFLNQRDILNSGVNFSDVRIGVKGKLDNWYYKLDVGYVNSKVSLKDVFFGYRFGNNQFQIGQFYEPFSMDLLTSSVDMKFPQATGAATAFGTYRKLGLSYTYNVDKLNFTFGTFSDNTGNNLSKISKAYSFHSRLIYRPIYSDNKLLHLALSPSWKKTDNEVELGSPGNSIIDIKSIAYVKLVDAKSQVRLGAEAHFAIDHFTIQGEYMLTNVWGSGYSYLAHGGYMEASYVPYGEKYNYDSSWGCLGRPKGKSLEFVARYNYLNMDDHSARILGGEYQDFSIGANYYFNKYFAVKLNYSCLFPINNIQFIEDKPLSMVQLRVLFVL